MTPEEAAAMRKQMEEEIRAQLEANASAMADMQMSGEDRVNLSFFVENGYFGLCGM